jgi:hypothetical protein
MLYNSIKQKMLLNNKRFILCWDEDNHKKSLGIASALIYIRDQIAPKFGTRVLTNMQQSLVLYEFQVRGEVETCCQGNVEQ